MIPRMSTNRNHTDIYFLRTKKALEDAGRDPEVTMQVFAKKEGIVAGIREVIGGLSKCDGIRSILTLKDGDSINEGEREPVMHITGRYLSFGWLETQIVGTLARRSLVATNTRRCVNAAGDVPVIYMGARHDDPLVQAGDNRSAIIGGAKAVSTEAALDPDIPVVGTIPHAMIAAFNGNTIEATLAFARSFPDLDVVSLVDYDNDVIPTSIVVARAMEQHFPGRLKAVRVDTSESLIDHSMHHSHGVTPNLVAELRVSLDSRGFEDVGIIVSGGFYPHKIERFVSETGVPTPAWSMVSGVGIGSCIIGHNRGEPDGLLTGFDFTADIVKVDGNPQAKAGRGLINSDRLCRV